MKRRYFHREPEPPAVEISSVYMRQMKAIFEKLKVVRNPQTLF